MEKKRIAYIDFIKVFAMFLVTYGHCAQSLSCQTFPQRYIPNDLFISIHMPLFMIASGFVINIDKIRFTPIKDYIYARISRLVIPMIIWILIYCLLTIQKPDFNSIFKIYWYLSALFFSLVIIKFLSTLIKRNTMLILTSLILVLIVPLSKTSHINFMFPFLIYGYLLKKFTNKINYSAAIITGVTFIWLYLRYWSIQHTVYLSPLNTLDINQGMIYSFLLRLLIGITGSTFIFIIAKYLDKSTFVQKISVYGRYTLVFYTMTTVINGVTRRIFSFMDFEILNPLFLDVSSICFALLQMYIIYNFAKVIEKKHILSKLLLGN